MSKKEKQLQKIRQNPQNVRFEDLDSLLQECGFSCRQPHGGSSHYVYVLETEQQTYQITVPYKRPFVKRVYVKHVLSIIDELNR